MALSEDERMQLAIRLGANEDEAVIVIVREGDSEDDVPDPVTVLVVEGDRILRATTAGMHFEITAYQGLDELEPVIPQTISALAYSVSVIHPN